MIESMYISSLQETKESIVIKRIAHGMCVDIASNHITTQATLFFIFPKHGYRVRLFREKTTVINPAVCVCRD